jgi:prepilin-type N-terminal cleavage/methylation domain-containing protein
MSKKAFTLLEIILAITIISVLLVILIRLINPNQQIADINNAQREADVLTIYTAINQYRNINSGNLPSGITNDIKSICQPGCTPDNSKIDISSDLESYIPFGNMPIDPQQQNSDTTGYSVYVNNQGNVIVSAPLAENGVTINTLNNQ